MADYQIPRNKEEVFEHIVRQALAGAPWKEIYPAVLQFNGITVAEIEQEVKLRWDHLRKPKDPPTSNS